MIKKIFTVTISSLGLAPLISLATNRDYPKFDPPPSDNVGPVTSVNDVLGVAVAAIDLAQVVFWITAAGFGLYGAYLYLFSQGSKESIGKAKNMMIYTVLAIFLALIAYALPAIITNFLDVGLA